MRTKLISSAMNLLEKQEGLRGVTLRDIAKNAGCAHTNVYNYFSNYPELIWAVFLEILQKLVADTEIYLHTPSSPRQNFNVFIASQVDFALAHPGWYRLLWLEKLPEDPPPEIMNFMRNLNRIFLEQIQQRLGKNVGKPKLQWIGDLVHGFLHGQICKMISSRTLKTQKLSKASVIHDVEWLLDTFNT